MQSFTGPPLSFLRVVLALFAVTTVSLVACQDMSATQQEPDQTTIEAQATNEAAPKPAPEATDQALTEDSDVAAEDDAIDYEESPHLDNRQTVTIEAKWQRLGKNQIWINHEDKQVMVRGLSLIHI